MMTEVTMLRLYSSCKTDVKINDRFLLITRSPLGVENILSEDI